ncbi:hypothetical protein CFP56_011149 [Quercus suber]|uniref:Uncharacterized protein n=1 Tax=Quercus suber TaxID=58331 RepID=A0AAW0L0J9_QUESU
MLQMYKRITPTYQLVSIIWLMKLFTIVLMEVLSLPFVCNNWQVLMWTGHDIHFTSSPSAFKSSKKETPTHLVMNYAQREE